MEPVAIHGPIASSQPEDTSAPCWRASSTAWPTPRGCASCNCSSPGRRSGELVAALVHAAGRVFQPPDVPGWCGFVATRGQQVRLLPVADPAWPSWSGSPRRSS